MRQRKGQSATSDSFALAVAVGVQVEEWEGDIGGSALRVQQLLETRAHAYVMAGAGHLHSWYVYAKKFVAYYTKRPSEHFRGPSALEAEEADRAALEEVFNLCSSGHSLDDALHHVTVERDLLRHLLMERPRLSRAAVLKASDKAPSRGRAPLKRKRGDSPKKRLCFTFRKSGECAFGKKCKFTHSANEE